MCRAPGGLWIVPPQGAVWIPGGVLHSNCVSDFGKIYVVFIDQVATKLPEFLLHVHDLTASSGVDNIGLRRFRRSIRRKGHQSGSVGVLLDELVQMSTEQMYLPISPDSRLQQLAVSLLRDPGDRSTLEEWATRYAMSERTLARLIVKG